MSIQVDDVVELIAPVRGRVHMVNPVERTATVHWSNTGRTSTVLLTALRRVTLPEQLADAGRELGR